MADELTRAARALGIDDNEVRVLALLPLVAVAWADGEVQAAERKLILDLATQRYGLDDEARRILQSWLTYAPSEGYVRQGTDLMVRLVRAERIELELTDDHPFDAVLGDALSVAKAAGGMLGFRAVDASEQAALEAIGAAIADAHHHPADPEPPRTVVDGSTGTALPTYDGSEDDLDEEVTATIRAGDAPFKPASMTTLPPDDVDDGVFSADELAALSQYGRHQGGGSFVLLVGEVEVPYAIGDELVVGRAGDCDVVLATDARVSRRNTRVYREDDRTWVADLSSTNGTWVNGERVTERRLFGGEAVRIGTTVFTFRAADA
ncbi:MAG: FHA domain-containing protein [Alphaproteobacteria bacterium]|nr:FHA domain-containing protein [Alphaproteobacteria bacterium]